MAILVLTKMLPPVSLKEKLEGTYFATCAHCMAQFNKLNGMFHPVYCASTVLAMQYCSFTSF